MSYAHKDTEFARALQQSLSRIGVESPAVEPDGGTKWEYELRAALAHSDGIVGVLTGASLESAFVMQELGAAMMLDKPLVLVKPDPDPLPSIRFPHEKILQGQGMTTDQIAERIQQRLAS